MIHTISLNYTPGAIEWVHDSSRMKGRLAVADVDSGVIRIYAEDTVGGVPLQTIELHGSPVTVIKVGSTDHGQALRPCPQFSIEGCVSP